ncbi:MAG: SRPBCC family protein [Myxococcota bacterium]
MSTLQIEEQFSVNAPPAKVWRYLLDPEEIVVCLPGAQLLEVEGERTFHGQMKVKVGPVTVAYKGVVELTDVDEAARIVQMVGTGKEKGGAGSAKMTMTSKLLTGDSGGTDVAVTADVKLAGRIVRFGRGMIKGVSQQLFKQFAENVRELIENAPDQPGDAEAADAEAAGDVEAATEAGAAAESDAAAGSETDAGAASEPDAAAASDADADTAADADADAGAGAESDADAAADAESDADAAAASEVEAASESGAETESAARAASGADTAANAEAASDGDSDAARADNPVQLSDRRADKGEAAAGEPPVSERRPARQLAPREVEPVRALPLLFKVIWQSITGFFRRLFGGGERR